MGDLFTEIEFEEPEDPSDNTPKTKIIWNEEKLASAKKDIDKEISKIKTGTSEFLKRAIDPGRFGFPAENLLINFLKNPSDEALERLHMLCQKNFSPRAGNHFHTLLKACREEVPNE